MTTLAPRTVWPIASIVLGLVGCDFGLSHYGRGPYCYWAGNAAPLSVAVGGTATVTALAPSCDGDPANAPVFDQPFDAASSDPSVVSVTATPPTFTLTGHAEGTAAIQLFDPSTNELYDQLDVTVATATRADLRSTEYRVTAATDTGPSALWAGGHVVLYPRLYAADGSRTADEKTTTALAAGSRGALDQRAWDDVELDVPTGVPSAQFSVTGGDGVAHAVTLPVATAVDQIVDEAVFGDAPVAQPQPVGQSFQMCFRALMGNVAVGGVPWSFAATGVDLGEGDRNCVTLYAEAPGNAQVTATAGKLSVAFPIVLRDYSR
jgi:hypothetical protein